MLSSVERTQSTMKTYLSHNECYDLAVQLSEQIKAGQQERKADLKRIVTIPRGGLVLSGWLSYLLNIPEVIMQATLDHELIGLHSFGEEDIPTLIVDDLIDTGVTLQPYKNLQFTTAALFKKPWSKVNPTYFVKETEDWIVFPWETNSEDPKNMEPNKDA